MALNERKSTYVMQMYKSVFALKNDTNSINTLYTDLFGYILNLTGNGRKCIFS